MNAQLAQALTRLADSGWKVILRDLSLPRRLPESVQTRYPWLPDSVKELLSSLDEATRDDECVWLLASADFHTDTQAAFAWNAWETLSLDAAEGDEEWQQAITEFWDAHFPLALSVADGYAYHALRQADLCIVQGREPEFEQTEVYGQSLDEFLLKLGHEKGAA